MKTYPVYLNGEWLVTTDSVGVVNPASEDIIGRMSQVERRHVVQALEDAHKAFAGWRQITGRGRGEILERIADEVHRRREELARIITLENGKPIAQSQGEVAMAEDHLRWFAEEARRVYGRVVPPQNESKRHLVIKTPMGVVAAISPWNFPLVLAVRKVAPALAAGCPVILKPARQTPLSAVTFAECVHAAELPAGVFQLVAGNAAEIGREFLDNPLCRKITFTGSTEVGRKLIAGAAARVKPLSLELGGNAPLLVFDDCSLDDAVKGTLLAKFRNTGQSCIAANRIYVQRGVYPAFLQSLTEKVVALKVGDGIDPQTQIGPLIDRAAVDKAAEHVNDAVNGGAKLLCGGHPLKREGFFFEPTVLADVGRNSLCMFEETFAPVAPLTCFDTEREAVALANNSDYGLSAYVFTNDMKRMFRLVESLEAGMIGVNDGLPTTSQCPFGGVKQSGWGRELGREGVDAFLDTKHISLQLD
ncbi:MAG: NAD-dependent succinate-semialdehyde dehydrogenase [Verrucomicrobiae bacterium]|nr:NAD-dependent succinate-semialdehyde dehydrogenase [Verrucomicrobiae bacterium]